MPKVSFPINPQENDIFVVNNITYQYSSGKWMNVSIGTVLSSITDYVDSTVASKDNTDEITEGATNLYYTNARSRAAISGTGAISYNSSTGAITTSQDLTTSGSPTFAGLTLANNMSITGDIIPTADNVYSLGSASYMWKDVYIGPGSLYVNGQKVIEDNSGTITFSADVGQSLQIATSGAGNIQLSTEPSGVVQISSTLQISSGKNITDSSGIQIGFGDAIQMNSNKIIGLGTPSNSTDAATKGYVDTSISNISTNSISQGNSSVAVNDSGTGSVNITVDGTTALSINSSGIVITGDVTVNGTTTTVNTATLNVSDNIITLNNDVVGTPTQNAGIEIERGDESNVSVRWNESTLVWQFTNDGATYHSIPTTANIRSAISASGSLSYNSSTGAISYTAPTNVSAFTNDAGYITSSDSISGNASTATVATTAGKWTTARTITLGGDLSGSVSIDGSGDVTLTAAVTDDSHNHIIDNVDGLQAALDAKLASASYTASDVLSKVLTVDGAGSGLDADLLDGVDSGSFLRSDADDSFTGTITNNGVFESFLDNNLPTVSPRIKLGRSGSQYMTFHGGGAGNFMTSISSSGNPKPTMYFGISTDGGSTLSGTYTLGGTGGSIWHSGNDGAGSGLDADLLDGVQGSSFFRSDVANTAIGFFSTTSVNGSGDSGIGIVSGGRLGFDESGVRSWSVKATGGNLVLSSGDDAGELISNNGITADSFTVTGAGGNIAPATGVEAWYITNNISVAADESEPRDLSFSSDGTKMYILGNTGNDITQYTLSTAWDVSTASTPTTFSVATQEGTPYGLYFKPDGTKFYVAGTTGDNIYQYACSTAWDVTTASWEKTFSVTGQETDPNAVFFKPDGTKMYVTGSTGDDVNEYNLSTAWDIATATYSTVYGLSAYSTAPQGLSFSSDGTKFWVVGTTYNRIAEFIMSTPWSVATATFSDYVNLYYVQYDENTLYTISGISGLYVNEAQGKAWITDYNTDRVYELTTNTPTTKFTGNKFSIESQLCSIKNSLIINRNLKVHGEIRQLGNAYFGAAYSNTHNSTSSSSTLNLGTGNSTGAVNLATALSSGAFTLGGTATTGIMTLGRSTSAHTLNIDSAGQASGVTKTINIGGSGLSGSITNINIGSSVSGSTGTVNIYSDTAVTGSLTATGEVTAYYSDRRLKENVTVIADPITKVLKLTGICYTPNDLAASFGYNKEEKIVGLFADEVESVLPEAIALAPFDRDEQGNSKSGENYKTVKYEKIVPLLVEAIKQQQDIIDKQNKKIDLLMKHLGLE